MNAYSERNIYLQNKVLYILWNIYIFMHVLYDSLLLLYFISLKYNSAIDRVHRQIITV